MSNLLNELVLVLNKDYLAVQIADVKDCISFLFTEKAKVITESYDTYSFEAWAKITKELKNDTEFASKYVGTIKSPSYELFIPQVVILKNGTYNTNTIKAIRFSRKNVFQRDNNTCQYCLKKFPKGELNIDHVIPKSRGGDNSWKNVVASCIYCNAKKGNKLLSEIKWTLPQEPKEPKWKSHIGLTFDKVRRNYWENFLR